jgi:hypothetical protein
MTCHFIPGYLLERLVEAGDDTLAACARRTVLLDERIRSQRATAPSPAKGAAWQIHDAQNGTALPGKLVRSAGDPEVGDVAVNEAATGITETLALFRDLGRDSFDDRGALVLATVHYEQGYDNAFWDGSQLVFGDGDGIVFDRFTKPIDVVGHELSHAVTQFTADMTYQGQSGALNESLSDVFGACLKQRYLHQNAEAADWLVGEGIFLPGVNGRALRSMSAPGTAYDDARIGKDPQVGSMADFVVTTDDNGGVHINSGIPNRAFTIAARAIGGESWSGAGRIWYAALTSGLSPDSDFATFAAATVAAAGDHADEVRQAWTTVSVTPGAGVATGDTGSAASAPHAVEVVRSGGLAGIRREGSVDLDSDDPRASRARELVGRIDFTAVTASQERPDRFRYHFRHGDLDCIVGERDLTDDLRHLAELLLEQPDKPPV